MLVLFYFNYYALQTSVKVVYYRQKLLVGITK